MQFNAGLRSLTLVASVATALMNSGIASRAADLHEEERASSFFARDLERANKASAKSAVAVRIGRPARSGRQPHPAIHSMVTAAAVRHKIPVAIAHSIVKAESNYNCNARSPAGAIGIMQTLTATARGVGVTGSLTDCQTSLEAGMRYLRQALDTHGTGCAGASAYERGIRSKPHCSSYGRKIMALAAAG
jgi:soluble lytic murein transglycosylase-like protein